MIKSNYRLKLESNSQFEFQKKAFTLTYICVPPTILQSLIFWGLNYNKFISKYLENFFSFFFVFLITYAIIHLIWTRIRGNYHRFNLILEKIGHLCVYGLYIFMFFLISMRVLNNFTVVENHNQNSIGENCQIVSMNQKFQSQEINENYYELEVQYQYKEFKEEKDYLLYKKLISEQKDIEQQNYLQHDIEMHSEEENNLFFSIINYLSKLEFISNSKNKIESFQKDSIEKSNSNNNIQQYEDFLQSLYTIKTKTAKACASDKSKKSLIDSIIDFETIPFMYYYFKDEVKMASWDCLDVQQLNKNYEQCYILNDEENENIYENQKKMDNERPEKFVRFQPSMHIDSDLECLLPYYGITMVCFGVQLFIISFLFEKINNEQIYKMLILRKKKFYVKSIDSFVTFTSMFPKKMTQELIKVELAKTFQIQENQVIFYVQTENDLASQQAHQVKNMERIGKNININLCQNKNNNNINTKKKQNRYVCIAFMTPHLRMVHSINAGKKILLQGLFRKEIASEIFQDFLNPKYYDFDKNPQYLAHNQENPYNNTIDIENYLQNDRFLINSAKIKINYLRIYKVLNKQIIQNLKQFAEDDEQQQELDGDLLEEENLPWVDQFNFADNMNKMLQYIDKKSSSIESRLLNDDSIMYV